MLICRFLPGQKIIPKVAVLSTQGTLCGFVSLTDLFQHSELTASIFAP
jgi:hypothetical protein